MNLLKNSETSEANSIRKRIKKEIRKTASSYYKCKVKDLFSTKRNNKPTTGLSFLTLDYAWKPRKVTTVLLNLDLNNLTNSNTRQVYAVSISTRFRLSWSNFRIWRSMETIQGRRIAFGRKYYWSSEAQKKVLDIAGNSRYYWTASQSTPNEGHAYLKTSKWRKK